MLPSWIPGSYLLREFARHVVAVRATADGTPVAAEQTAKGTWTVAGAQGSVEVVATVYALDPSIRGAYLDRDRAYFNGTSLFLLPVGRENDAVELSLEPPTLPYARDWQVATAMRPEAVDSRGFGRYLADDYDELIDHPFEIGRHEVVAFEAAGVPHRFVITGRSDGADVERLATDLSRLCTAQIGFFGKPPPFDSYTFLGQAVGNGYGGLEHRASSSLIFRRAGLPRPGEDEVGREYETLLGLVSHEYFHSWNIKQSKPAAFMPYRLDRRNHTRLLWVFEGITSYYQELFLVRSGLLGTDEFLRRLGELLTRVYRVPGRLQQSLADSSFNAWDHLYKPDPDSANARVSYYSKGALVALALDLWLRQHTAVSLDDVVLEIWRRFGCRDIGLPESGFEDLVAELAGEPCRSFVAAAVHGTRDPDLAALAAAFGLRLAFRQAEGPQDLGGTAPTAKRSRLGLGAAYEATPAGLKLTVVLDGQPAQAAGLAPGDIILALDGIQASADGLAERLRRHEEGDELRVSYFRGDELRETGLRLAAAPADTCYIELDTGAAPDAAARRRAWIGD